MARRRRARDAPHDAIVRLARLPLVERLQLLRSLRSVELKRLDTEWRAWAMEAQTAPGRDWRVPAGAILPFRASHVRATGTTAADILALY